MNNLNLTEDEVNSLFWGDNVYKDSETEEEILYKHIQKTIINNDSEHSATDYVVVIEYIPTGKFYSTILCDSPYINQSEENAEFIWKEVKLVTKTIEVYE